MTVNTSTLASEIPSIIVLTPLLQEALRLGGVVDWVEYHHPAGAEAPASLKFNVIIVNEDKAKIPHLHVITPDKLGWAVMTVEEAKQAEKFVDYLAELEDKRVLVTSLKDGYLAKLVKPSDSSRYFPNGRKKIRGKIYKRLGRWFNCPGYLLSLTFDPGKISRTDAWKLVGKLRREFMNRVNRWRKRHGYSKAKCIPVLEVQPATGYPHIHIVFPYLRYLAPIVWMREQWGQAENSVNFQVKDSVSPVSYVCKYISKLEGWSDIALSYLWVNRTRLYSMSRDYILPDYSDKRVPEWEFKKCLSKSQAVKLVHDYTEITFLGADDLINETPQESYAEWVAEKIRRERKNNMSNCGWCGKVINGEPASTIESGAMIMGNGETEIEIMPEYEADFCCNGCAWAFLAETHRLYGLSGKDLRNHLINEHGLSYPPGKPDGVMRDDCLIINMARSLALLFS